MLNLRWLSLSDTVCLSVWSDVLLRLYRVPMHHGKSWIFSWIFRALESAGISVWSWKLTAWAPENYWKMKIVDSWWIYWGWISITESFLTIFTWTLSIRLHSVCAVIHCCLSLYFNIGGLREGPGKPYWRFWKVLELFLSESVWTLDYSASGIEAGTVCLAISWVVNFLVTDNSRTDTTTCRSWRCRFHFQQ